ncbi:MAG: MFS transporter [Acidobacteria bacterium]|nr:MFS transporter [Acidobacteriota bacterium]MCI0620910.1 MFS transporter [Acidobacteriota bacterium]MCI0720374.1 MFS transporter [Acidobacteriota bacterium]
MIQRSAVRPSRARYWVIVFAVTLSVITYIDRVCISQAAPEISRDLGLSKVEMGYAFSAFALAYALFEIPGGWWGDKIGARKVLMRVVICWSFFTAATGWAWNLLSLVFTRFWFGAGEAGCFPNLTKAFTTWLPQDERVKAQGIMWMSARWGGAFTPMLVVLVFHFMSWRYAFGLFGALGVVWAVFFYRWFRDDPRQHKSVNEGELALLKGTEHLVSGHGDVPWKKLVTSRTVWLLWIQYFLLAYPWYFYITWLPTYLQEFRRQDQARSALLAGIPLLFGGFGSLFCGFLSSYLTGLTGSVRKTRRLMGTLGFLCASILLTLSVNIPDVTIAMLVMGLASFANDLVMPGSWGACMDIGGKYAGTLSGSMNMMGNLAGFVAPVVTGYILQSTNQNWNINLYVMAGVYFLGVLTWPFIDPVTPLEESSLGKVHP